MSHLYSRTEIKKLEQNAVMNFAVSVLAKVTECAREEDAPLYKGDEEIDMFVKLSDVNECINKALAEMKGEKENDKN